MDRDNLQNELRLNLNELYHSKVTSAFIDFIQGEGAVLLCLKHNGGPICPSAISEMVCLSRARVTNIINSLKQKELVVIEHDENDRRKTHVMLTEKGIQFVIEGANHIEMYVDSLFDAIGEEKILTLIDVVKTVNDTFKRWEREAENKDE